jgi:hypothetical protein
MRVLCLAQGLAPCARCDAGRGGVGGGDARAVPRAAVVNAGKGGEGEDCQAASSGDGVGRASGEPCTGEVVRSRSGALCFAASYSLIFDVLSAAVIFFLVVFESAPIRSRLRREAEGQRLTRLPKRGNIGVSTVTFILSISIF